MIHKYYYVKIIESIRHTEDVISIISERPADFYYHPGQFIMLWIPSINEKPFAVSNIKEGSLEITVRIIGEFTKEIAGLKPGDKIGIRGPFGRGFNLVTEEDSIIVAGGVGIASLSLLALNYPSIPLLYGSRSQADIIFPDRFRNCIYATDDGSYGEKGLITDIFKKTASEFNVRRVYACGPEKMLYNLYIICRESGIRMFASLERYMKCGIGICGQCVIDDRITCIDGPVFDDRELSDMKEFGRIRYNKAGQRERI